MQIKFSQLLQDSLNFLRNNRSFSITAFFAILGFQLIGYAMNLVYTPNDIENAQSGSTVLILVLISLVHLYVNVLIILNIIAINNGQYKSFLSPIPTAFSRLLPFIVVMFFVTLPISIAVALALTTQLGGAGGLLIIALLLFISGIYIFIKLCLAPYVFFYETPKMGVFQTLKHTWKLSRGKFFPLLIYAFINYGIVNIISQLSTDFNHIVVDIVRAIILSGLSLFFTVFGFRFYQVYRSN